MVELIELKWKKHSWLSLIVATTEATGHHTCGAIRTLVEGEAKLRDRGCHDAFELDLAGARRLLGKIMVSQDATIFCFLVKISRSYFLERYQLTRTST
jgi:hypothetical protein